MGCSVKPRRPATDPFAEIHDAPPPRFGPPCGIIAYVNQLNPAAVEGLAGTLASTSPGATNQRIADRLINLGITNASPEVVAHHRKGACSCWRRPDGWKQGRRGPIR